MTNLSLRWTVITVFVLIGIFGINFIILRSWGVDIKGTQGADTMQGTATDDDIRANVTEASESIKTESEDSLRTLIAETRDILNNLTESVRQFLGGG